MSEDEVRKVLKQYKALLTGGRLSGREDTLGAQRMRQESAPFEATAVVKADVERVTGLCFDMACAYELLVLNLPVDVIARSLGIEVKAVYRAVDRYVEDTTRKINGSGPRQRRPSRDKRESRVDLAKLAHKEAAPT